MGSLIDEFESPVWLEGNLCVGVDEAGRGPMAGPVVVAGVVFPSGFYDERINDSKKMTDKNRRALVELIKENAVWFMVDVVSVEQIDALNIYRATQLSMERIVSMAPADLALTDAMPLTVHQIPFIDIVKGDSRSISIAAASILAKTVRDDLMIELDKRYPQYGFKNHKGYGTKMHKEAILKFGRCPEHRKSFRFKDELRVSLDI